MNTDMAARSDLPRGCTPHDGDRHVVGIDYFNLREGAREDSLGTIHAVQAKPAMWSIWILGFEEQRRRMLGMAAAADITGKQTMCVRMSRLRSEGRPRSSTRLTKPATASGAQRISATARDILGDNVIPLNHHVARHHADIEAVDTYEDIGSTQSLTPRTSDHRDQRLH